MAKTIFNFHRKISLFFFLAIVLALILVFLTDLCFSLVLNKYIKEAKDNFRANLGINLETGTAYFEVFTGIYLTNLSIRNEKDTIFFAKKAVLKPNILSLILKKELVFSRINVVDPHIYKINHLDKSFLSALLIGIKDAEQMLKSTTFRFSNLNFMDLADLDLQGYIAMAQNKLLLSRGKFKIENAAFLNRKFNPKSSLLNGQISYSLEATFQDSDLIVNKFDLLSPSTKLILSGSIEDIKGLFNLKLKGEIKNFLLENVFLLNNEYFSSNGLLEINFSLDGELPIPNFTSSIKVLNGNLSILNTFAITKVNTILALDNQGLRAENIFAFVGESPVNLGISIDRNGFAIFNLNFINENKIDLLKKINLGFQGFLSNKNLKGQIRLVSDYLSNKEIKSTAFVLKDFLFDFNNFNFSSQLFDISFNDSNQWDVLDKIKTLEFQDFNCNLDISKNRLTLSDLKAKLHSGILTGETNFDFGVKGVFYSSSINFKNIEAQPLASEFLSSQYQLTGILSGKVSIDSRESDSIVGDIQISDGKIENNAILIAISDFFGIPSLKNIEFNTIKFLFRKIWDKYESQVSLNSKDVEIYLDNHLFPDSTMDGYLLVNLTTNLMDESPRFKKLFRYIGYKEPIVYFPFKLKGYVNNPRIEWLKNEFKDKLQNFLSESNKKILQDALNKLVVGFGQ